MCQPVKNYLNLIRDYTREVVMFGGIALAILVYVDFRALSQEMARNVAATNEILRNMDARLRDLEHWHALEQQQHTTAQP